MRKNRPSIRDVARESGVSPTTVSLVINRADHRISAPTRQRVLQAIERLKYRPSRLAQGLPSRSSRTLAIILPELHMAFADAYFGEIISGIYDCAAEYDYRIMLEVARRSFIRQKRYLSILEDCSVDGMLFLGSTEKERWLEEFSGSDRPLLLVNNRFAHWDLDTILCDYPAAGRLAADYLVGLGHREVAHIAGPSSQVLTAEEMSTAFVDRMNEHGVSLPDRRIVSADFQIEAGVRATEALLARDPELTAIFCGNDKIAIGAMQAAKAKGRAVGSALSIVGCDDLPAAAVADPPLTTIRLNYYDLGYAAARKMLRRLGVSMNANGESNGSPRIPVHLVERESASALESAERGR
ncbi:MAG: LacI family DNA-binding transcriptional regulator [Phycisphaerales bacterium]